MGSKGLMGRARHGVHVNREGCIRVSGYYHDVTRTTAHIKGKLAHTFNEDSFQSN